MPFATRALPERDRQSPWRPTPGPRQRHRPRRVCRRRLHRPRPVQLRRARAAGPARWRPRQHRRRPRPARHPPDSSGASPRMSRHALLHPPQRLRRRPDRQRDRPRAQHPRQPRRDRPGRVHLLRRRRVGGAAAVRSRRRIDPPARDRPLLPFLRGRGRLAPGCGRPTRAGGDRVDSTKASESSADSPWPRRCARDAHRLCSPGSLTVVGATRSGWTAVDRPPAARPPPRQCGRGRWPRGCLR